MPINFLIVGLCARDYGKLSLQGKEDYDDDHFAPLAKANLCEIVCPFPKELDGIVPRDPPYRLRHRASGRMWTEDSMGPIGKARNEWEVIYLEKSEIRQLELKYGSGGYDWEVWQRKNWGVKWGTYGTKVHELGGDWSPVLIEFQTPWTAPSKNVMAKIDDYLCETYCLENISWMYHDPGSRTTGVVR